MNHLQRYLVEEFVEDYQEGYLSRRDALKRIAGITGMAAATQILAACGEPATPNTAELPTAAGAASTAAAVPPTSAVTTATAPTAAATTATAPTSAAEPTAGTGATVPTAGTATGAAIDSVAADDPAVVAGAVQFPGTDAQLLGYMAHPAGQGTFPIVLVCHENRGLTPYIQDVTRRVAKAGYVGLAVDLLSREGGIDKVTDANSIPGLLSAAPPERNVQDFAAGLAYAKTQSFANPNSVGMVGFCYGGGITWLVAAGLPELKAAVPFYGPPPPVEQLAKINAAVLAIYAEQDTRITSSAATIEPAMQQAGKTYRKDILPGVNHAFHNDTGERYNADAAHAAWTETLAWFKQYLPAA